MRESIEIRGGRAYRLLIGDREYYLWIPRVSSVLRVYRRLIAFCELSSPIQPVFSGFRPYRRLIVFREYFVSERASSEMIHKNV